MVPSASGRCWGCGAPKADPGGLPPRRVRGKAEVRGGLAGTARRPWGAACSGVSFGCRRRALGLGTPGQSCDGRGPLGTSATSGASRSENRILSPALPYAGPRPQELLL